MRSTPTIANKAFYPFHYLIPYLLAWWLLSGNQGWAFGLPAAVIATALAVWLGLKPWHIRLRFLPSFVFFFFREMFVGAWDVALRTLKPHLPVNPGWEAYELTVTQLRVRLLCSSLMGLMPGTLASRIEGDRLWIHALDKEHGWRDTVKQLEKQLDRLIAS